MRSAVRRFCLSLVVLAGACGGSDDPSPYQVPNPGPQPGAPVVTNAVAVRDNVFSPNAVQVAPGTTVRWTWADDAHEHNVSFTDGTGSENLSASGTYSRPFPTAGTFTYRCTLHPGSLFAPPPAAGMYLLARVLHDWDDDDAVKILVSVGAGHGSRLRIFERLLPDDDRPDRAKMSDVAMLMLVGGRERTAGQYRKLLEKAGWQMGQIVTSPGGMSVIEASRPPNGSR